MLATFTLTGEDLLTDISKPELDGITTNLIEAGQTEPIDKEVAESLAIISMYVEPWLIREDMLRRLWRLLAISGLYNRLGVMPDKRKDERNWCLSVLTQIRDGKFPLLLLDPDEPVVDAGGTAWGSRRPVCFGGLSGVSSDPVTWDPTVRSPL